MSDHSQAHGHDHSGHGHIHEHRDIRPLRIAIGLTATVFIVQVVGGVISGSLALLSDAGHVLVDLASLLIAFFGLRIAAKAREQHDVKYTFGLRRIEILAALTNGFLLVGICIYIVVEAIRRLAEPTHVHAESMLAVAVIGLIANAVSALYLHRSEHITTRSAYLHVITDLLSSAGVIVAAVVIAVTSWVWVDPVISILIALLITRGAIRVIRESSIILMESAPAGVSPVDVRAAIGRIDGITNVHDVHVWQLTLNDNTATVHVVSSRDTDDVVRDVRATLKESFGIEHVTVQVESEQLHIDGECGACE
ncbi:MAG: cation diffusion facilitator family transporter [Candidatus Kapabacteria bacterium]|nr:cation diffusion facilitator family transporter [Candidatus Kapabacteria bacterium]